MRAAVDPSGVIASFAGSALARWHALAPWVLTAQSAAIVADLLRDLDPADYAVTDGVAVVGDSVLGANVNFEAGSIVCNYRNERADKEVRVRLADGLHRTGVDKFGALVGDGARIGANAVLAPGALLPTGAVVRRGALCDQEDPADEARDRPLAAAAR